MLNSDGSALADWAHGSGKMTLETALKLQRDSEFIGIDDPYKMLDDGDLQIEASTTNLQTQVARVLDQLAIIVRTR